MGVHPREWTVPDDGTDPEYVGADPLAGAAGCLLALVMAAAVLMIMGVTWLALL